MHAVVVHVEIDAGKADEAQTLLDEGVVPQVKQAPGFVSGTWAHSADGTRGQGLILFDSEDAAKAAATQAAEGPPPGGPVKFVSAEVFEVVAQA